MLFLSNSGTAGGGGRGMKIAFSENEVATAFSLARSEAKACFGNDQVYMVRYLRKPRHIEVQVLCDEHGNINNCVSVTFQSTRKY